MVPAMVIPYGDPYGDPFWTPLSSYLCHVRVSHLLMSFFSYK